MISRASIAGSRTWDIATRVVGASCLAIIAAAAVAAILATLRQLASAGAHAGPVATLVVNVCVFLLLLIEITLIVCRPRALTKATGVLTRLSALAGTWIMFLVVFLPVRNDLPVPMFFLSAGLATLGDLLALYVVLHLGRSYSIMAEARQLVDSGPYRVVRHPLYLAEELALAGALITYFSWQALVLFAMQLFFQYVRARNEERVLGRAFPAYRTYMRRTPMLLPARPHRSRLLF